jgi:FkbM family methyltransferase
MIKNETAHTAKPAMKNFATILEHTIALEPLLNRNPIVFDCGSNKGEFAIWAAEQLNATVYSYEADPELFRELPQVDRVHFFPCAVAGTEGTILLNQNDNSCSSTRFDEGGLTSKKVEVKAVTLEGERQRLGVQSIDLIKLDIEGAELEVLQNAPTELLGITSQITVEFHDFLDSSDVIIIKEVIARMRKAGFCELRFSTRTYGDVLFFNRDLIDGNVISHLKAMFHRRVLGGIDRNLRRILNRP